MNPSEPPTVSLTTSTVAIGAARTQSAVSTVLPSMDPRLQRLLALRLHGVPRVTTASTDADEVAVIGRVTDPEAWEALSEVRVGTSIPGGADGTIVTARIPLSRVDVVRQQPFVKSLKAARRLRPLLDATVREIQGADPDVPANALTVHGRGAIVGIVDFGFDFAHQNFRKADGGSRCLMIWDQEGSLAQSSAVKYGRLYESVAIDAALHTADPYTSLGYEPQDDPQGTHGTHVTDIAAGNGRGSGTPGVASEADIIFVQLSGSDIPWDTADAVGKSFGDSVQLLEAVQFIFERAGTRPCVVNLSLGTNGGPHDGSTLVEQGLDRLVRQQPNRAIVIAAANAFADNIHATRTVAQGGTVELGWLIPHSDGSNNEVEIWYAGEDRLSLEILGPDGSSVLRVAPGQSQSVLGPDGHVVLFAANRLDDPNNHDNTIGVFVESDLPGGRWVLRLHGDEIVSNGLVHAWIERQDSGPSSFDVPFDNSHTLGSISTGHETIVVGSYDAHKTALPLSFFSSEGPTRDGREKPEISAPGHDVLAAQSRTGTGVTRKSGTSMASPAVAGVLALALAEAAARGLALDIAQTRAIVVASVRRNPPAGTGWHSRLGAGRISAADAIEAVIALAPAPPVAPADSFALSGGP